MNDFEAGGRRKGISLDSFSLQESLFIVGLYKEAYEKYTTTAIDPGYSLRTNSTAGCFVGFDQ